MDAEPGNEHITIHASLLSLLACYSKCLRLTLLLLLLHYYYLLLLLLLI